MKLEDIKRKPTLNDLFDVPGELNWSKTAWMSESLNSKAKDIKWSSVGRNMNGTFNVDDSTYVIEIQPDDYEINGKKYNYINAAFHKIGPNNEPHYELQLNTKRPGLVIGCIFNGIFDKIKEYHYDALMFAATEDIQKRMKFYNKVASLFSKNFKIICHDIKTKNGMCTIMIGYHVLNSDVSEFIEHIKEKQLTK